MKAGDTRYTVEAEGVRVWLVLVVLDDGDIIGHSTYFASGHQQATRTVEKARLIETAAEAKARWMKVRARDE